MTFPHLRLPDAKLLFHRRAERFAALAPGHTLREYLELLAEVAVAQRAAIETVQPSLPGTLALSDRSTPSRSDAAPSGSWR